MQSQKPGGTIYAIGEQGTPFVKIGCTGNAVKKRLAALQTAHHLLLEILAAVPVEEHLYALEKQLHRFLAASKVRREWFKVRIDGVIFEGLVRLAAQALRESDPPAPMDTTIGAFLAIHPQEDFSYHRGDNSLWYVPHDVGHPRFLGSAIPEPDEDPDQIRQERLQERVCRVLIRDRELFWSDLQRRVNRYGIRGPHLEVIVETLRVRGVLQVVTRPGGLSRRLVVWIGPDTEEAALWGPAPLERP